jgi:hypothetical protein
MMNEYVPADIRREENGWGKTVVFGDRSYPAAVRRYIYRTREQARYGDISDSIGQRGRIG